MEPYLALFEPDREAGGYVVTFPDFGYGVTQGETEEEAMEMAQDLLMLTISDNIKESKPLPSASAVAARSSVLWRYRRFKLPRSISTFRSWNRA